MGWLPEEYSDAFWFAVTPITTIPLLVYTGASTVSGDWRYGKPDTKANIRNAAIWAAIAGAVFSWNAIVHPGKYQFMTGSDAFKGVVHIASKSPAFVPAAVAAVAVGSAVGWAATAEHHGAVAPGTGMGMPMTSDLYSQGTASNPAGWDFSTWWSNIV